MKHTLTILALLSTICLHAQNKSICLDINGWTYEISLNDSLKEYTFYSIGNLTCTGWVEWERGSYNLSQDTLILKSYEPYTWNTLRKIVLTRSSEVKEDQFYFLSCLSSKESNEIWKLTELENESFMKHLKKQRAEQEEWEREYYKE